MLLVEAVCSFLIGSVGFLSPFKKCYPYGTKCILFIEQSILPRQNHPKRAKREQGNDLDLYNVIKRQEEIVPEQGLPV